MVKDPDSPLAGYSVGESIVLMYQGFGFGPDQGRYKNQPMNA